MWDVCILTSWSIQSQLYWTNKSFLITC
uniref:Uncharacterized protein n=1 Tax=Medicago truncatula TaxID=3880 RepID=B7FFY3_MEDTR|nr:unknown [Medicago truncatula]